jgi:hypothetical protein
VQTRYLGTVSEIVQNAFHFEGGSHVKFQVAILNDNTRGLTDFASRKRATVVSRNSPASVEPKINFKATFLCSRDVTWDGVACEEPKGKLVFQSNSFVKSEFKFVDKYSQNLIPEVQVGKQLDEVTVEFWIKPSTQSQRQ